MDSGIVIAVNLLGNLGTRVRHTTFQTHSVEVTNAAGKSQLVKVDILHTDRVPSRCVREIQIAPSVVALWKNSECPYWADNRIWKKFNAAQKIQAFVGRFDEGYGVSYV